MKPEEPEIGTSMEDCNAYTVYNKSDALAQLIMVSSINDANIELTDTCVRKINLGEATVDVRTKFRSTS